MKKGWEKKALKETAKVIGGYSFRSSEFNKSGKYQVIRMGNVRPGTIRPDENPVFIDSLDEKILNRAQLLPNDVVITQTGTRKKRDYGYTAIVDSDNYLLNQRIAAIRFSDNYLPKFFLYYSWTNFFKDQYFSNETGTVGQGNVGISAITDALIPFCKLSEQKRIVTILDEAFTAIDKAKANAEKNLQNSRELFDSYLNNAFANPGEDWKEKTLGEVCIVIAGQSPEGKYYNNSQNGLPFYQGKKEFKDKYIGKPTTWTTKITKVAEQGDILMSVRAPVGPVNFSTQKICIGRGLAAIRGNNQINKEFLFNFLFRIIPLS